MRNVYQTFLIAALSAGALPMPAHADVLTMTNLPDVRAIENFRTNLGFGESVSVDLNEFFAVFPDPGPQVSIHFEMPAFDEVRPIDIAVSGDASGNPIKDPDRQNLQDLPTYQTVSGERYDHILDARPDRFVWEEHTVTFQLYPEESPITVANFLRYVQNGDYEQTIVHRRVDNPDVLQAGGFHFKDHDFPQGIGTRQTIPLEPNLPHDPGTLAMARSQQPNSARSQFFINLSNVGLPTEQYAAFGELVSEGDLDPLLEMGTSIIGALQNEQPSWGDIPLYAPYYYADPEYSRQSFAVFDAFSVSEGSVNGIELSWTFSDPPEGDDDEEDPPEFDDDSFRVEIDDDGILTIRQRDTGFTSIEVTGSYEGQERTFRWDLASFNPDVAYHIGPQVETFPGNRYVQPTIGTVYDIRAPYVYHESLGSIWISQRQPSPDESIIGSGQLYIKSEDFGWLWTSHSENISASRPAWPWMYNITHNKWLYLVTESGPQQPIFFDFEEEQWVYYDTASDSFEPMPTQ